ncbi:hypothetical protein JTB14_011267 [Gonioctena quinquepunctata]|nr:hypothetical protein JTB14_011267 [Gonioctena quinquepunctata]
MSRLAEDKGYCLETPISHLSRNLPTGIEGKHLTSCQKHHSRRPHQSSSEPEDSPAAVSSSEGQWTEKTTGMPGSESNKKCGFLKCGMGSQGRGLRKQAIRCKEREDKPRFVREVASSKETVW